MSETEGFHITFGEDEASWENLNLDSLSLGGGNPVGQLRWQIGYRLT